MEDLEFLLELFKKERAKNMEGIQAAAKMSDWGLAAVRHGRGEAYKDVVITLERVIREREK